ncbi:MAG: hypothetical protein UR73_C0001G0001 [candidate division WS6 bacterium GW2011_GWF1_35_23]|uniref:Uncharacterized protein n=1 Tax=candidate division WS6 bacterium GW2011_GWF1_35_23 TaxID=1619097 RepID=A0A0G0CQ80_9BACT|nr:MAG: hypothetical protein UR73_C0001G0001 [candidate division WS6 bacterium GW2011_GWF1_35_23]
MSNDYKEEKINKVFDKIFYYNIAKKVNNNYYLRSGGNNYNNLKVDLQEREFIIKKDTLKDKNVFFNPDYKFKEEINKEDFILLAKKEYENLRNYNLCRDDNNFRYIIKGFNTYYDASNNNDKNNNLIVSLGRINCSKTFISKYYNYLEEDKENNEEFKDYKSLLDD